MKKILFLILVIFFTTNCVKNTYLDANEQPNVVVECILDNCETQILKLSYTKGASSNEMQKVTEATARLYSVVNRDIQEIGQFEKQEDGVWTLDYTPEKFVAYRLEVDVPGYGLISAVDTIPGPPKVAVEAWGEKI